MLLPFSVSKAYTSAAGLQAESSSGEEFG